MQLDVLSILSKEDKMGTYTTNYNLFMPSIGEQGWGELVNGNFTTIDTTMAGLDTRIGTLETETDAIEERVTVLEAGEFESITVANGIDGAIKINVGTSNQGIGSYKYNFSSNGTISTTKAGKSFSFDLGTITITEKTLTKYKGFDFEDSSIPPITITFSLVSRNTSSYASPLSVSNLDIKQNGTTIKNGSFSHTNTPSISISTTAFSVGDTISASASVSNWDGNVSVTATLKVTPISTGYLYPAP